MASECPEGWVRDPKDKLGIKCIRDKKSSIKKGKIEYEKYRDAKPDLPKPATKEQLSKMKKDYNKRNKKPHTENQSLWSRLFGG